MVLLAFSMVALAFIIERFIALRRAKINVNEFLAKIRKALIVNHSVREAIKICEQYRGPVASIMKAGLLKYGQPKEDIEKTIENAALYEMGRLERGLVVLATVANVAPLLGFLGTVTGMIKSFDALQEAGLSNPGLVAGGISEALITTAAGLFIAIPVQIAYNYFMSRINQLRPRHRDGDQHAARDLHGDGPQRRHRRARRRRGRALDDAVAGRRLREQEIG